MSYSKSQISLGVIMKDCEEEHFNFLEPRLLNLSLVDINLEGIAGVLHT